MYKNKLNLRQKYIYFETKNRLIVLEACCVELEEIDDGESNVEDTKFLFSNDFTTKKTVLFSTPLTTSGIYQLLIRNIQ